MDKQILQLLKKFLDDRCTPEELEQVRTILQSDQYEEEWAAVLQEDSERSINEEASPVFEKEQADQLLDRISKSAGIEKTKEVEQPSGRWWYAAAASVLLMITAGLAFLTISTVSESESGAVAITKAGEQAEVLLPDGSRVWLNDMSTLNYPEEFTGDTRTVHLEGKAFFEVASNPSQPFLVETGELTIRVLGTEFDVSAYDKDRDMTVTVASGSVGVLLGASLIPEISGSMIEEPENQAVNRLQAGDQLTYDRQSYEFLRQTMALSDIRILRRGGLVFQNKTLEDIARALERRYDMSFRFKEDVAKQQRLTFKPNSEDPDEVLEVLSLVSGLEYERKDREVVMREK